MPKPPYSAGEDWKTCLPDSTKALIVNVTREVLAKHDAALGNKASSMNAALERVENDIMRKCCPPSGLRTRGNFTQRRIAKAVDFYLNQELVAHLIESVTPA